MDYGLQLYSVRDITGQDLAGAMEQVAALGYRFVEFAGFFGHSAEEVKAMLDKTDLAVSGTHTGWQELTADRIDETIAYHTAIGNKNIIIPGADTSAADRNTGDPGRPHDRLLLVSECQCFAGIKC